MAHLIASVVNAKKRKMGDCECDSIDCDSIDCHCNATIKNTKKLKKSFAILTRLMIIHRQHEHIVKMLDNIIKYATIKKNSQHKRIYIFQNVKNDVDNSKTTEIQSIRKFVDILERQVDCIVSLEESKLLHKNNDNLIDNNNDDDCDYDLRLVLTVSL